MQTTVDALGYPCKVGDLVLTAEYSIPTFSKITPIKHITKSGKVQFEFTKSKWDTATLSIVQESTTVTRQSYQFVLFNAQHEYNKHNYPEVSL
jgi:hypothetical protein